MVSTAPPRHESATTKAVRAAAAVAFTAFIAWYAIDFAQTRGSTTIEFAAWLWVALLGWLVVVVGILGLQLDLGERYHGARAFERSGRLYRLLRVPQAKRFMPNGDYAIRIVRRLRPDYRLVSGRESARRWELTTRSKEAGHLVHLILTAPLAGYLLVNGAIAAMAATAILDVAFDLYPIMTQRYNRMRIMRLQAIRAAATAGARGAPRPASGGPVTRL